MKMRLTTKILIGLAAGIVVGLLMGEGNVDFIQQYLLPFGTLFLRLLQMVIVPLVLSSLVVGACSLGDLGKMGRIGGKTVAIYIVTTTIAIVIGLFFGNILQPGEGLPLDVDAAYEAPEERNILITLIEIIPTNAVDAMAGGAMLQIIAFALFLGVGITIVGDQAKPVSDFFDALAEVMYKVTGVVLQYAPIGVFFLMLPVAAAHGPSVLAPLGKVIAAVYIGAILHVAIVYSGLVKIFAGMSPLKFFKGIIPAATVAFASCSSAATLPTTIKCARENLGVSRGVASFVLPLGATINMDGTALYQGVCALFVAQAYGLSLDVGQQVTVVLTAVLASIGTAGVPGAGLIMLTMVLHEVGLPLEGIALVAGIDRILDMARTTVNIIGDAAVSVAVASTENELEVPPDQVEAKL